MHFVPIMFVTIMANHVCRSYRIARITFDIIAGCPSLIFINDSHLLVDCHVLYINDNCNLIGSTLEIHVRYIVL